MEGKFIKYIDNHDLMSIRSILTYELMIDPCGKSFYEKLGYAESKLEDLYEVDDNVRYDNDIAHWDEDLLFKVKNDLDKNFSKERLIFYEEIAKYVLRDKIVELDNKDKQQSKNSSREQESTAKENSNKKLYAGIAIGGAVVTVAGIALSKTVITTIGVAGVLVGGALLLKKSKK